MSTNYAALSSQDLGRMAAAHERRLPTGHPARALAANLDWRFDRMFFLDQLAEEEHETKARYRTLRDTQPDWEAFEAWWNRENDTVITVVLVEGKAHVWDGIKRVASSRFHGSSNVRALIGQKPLCRRPYLASQDGKFYVVTQDLLNDRPVIQELWWPTGARTYDVLRNFGSDLLGSTVDRSQDNAGVYVLYRPSWSNPLRIALAQYGETRATISRFVDVPQPKVRRGTTVQWMRGGWHKLTTNGWIPA